MKRFAVGVVILPPDPVMDLALEWNQLLCKTHPTNIVLDKIHYLPHITMAMGCLPEDQLEHANALLKSITSKHQPLELKAPYFKTVDTSSGDTVVTLDIYPSPELAELHESIVTAFSPLFSQDVTEVDIYDPPPIDPSAIDWINRYIPHYCFQDFWPHITLGFGEAPADFKPYSFTASRMAICHLGNHCTCRNILGEAFLTSL